MYWIIKGVKNLFLFETAAYNVLQYSYPGKNVRNISANKMMSAIDLI